MIFVALNSAILPSERLNRTTTGFFVFLIAIKLTLFAILFLLFLHFLILLLIIYLIYKIFILETDVYIINERLSKIELQFNKPKSIEKTTFNNEEIDIANNFMNEIFTNKEADEEPSSIDIDEIIKKDDNPPVKEEIFDLKKDVMNADDNQSIISSSNNKKKLQKLNLEKLKDKCQELGLSQEGSKANLIDRIIDEGNKDV
jgi:hypothetical protein